MNEAKSILVFFSTRVGGASGFHFWVEVCPECGEAHCEFKAVSAAIQFAEWNYDTASKGVLR